MTKFFYWVTKIGLYIFIVGAISGLLLTIFGESNDFFPMWLVYLSAALSSLLNAAICFVLNNYIEQLWYAEQNSEYSSEEYSCEEASE